MPAALDDLDDRRIGGEARLTHQQHGVAVDRDDAACTRRRDDAVFAPQPVRVHDIVDVEAQPCVLVHHASSAPLVARAARGVPTRIYGYSARPAGSTTASISSGFDFQNP